MSTPTTVVQISASYIFYKAGIRCVLVLGRYKYHKKIIDFGCFQVSISSQNHDIHIHTYRVVVLYGKNRQRNRHVLDIGGAIYDAWALAWIIRSDQMGPRVPWW